MGRSRVVMIVDDEPLIRNIIARALRAAGYEVVEAGGVEQALSVALSPAAPDLAILDCNLSTARDGIALAGQLSERRPSMPLVGMSGDPVETDFIAAGTCAFFAKPLDFPALLETVSDLLGGPVRGPAGAAAFPSSGPHPTDP